MDTRAGNQRSSIFQGNDGLWSGFVTIGIRPDGSPDRRKRTGATRAEVVRKVREPQRHALHDVDTGVSDVYAVAPMRSAMWAGSG